MIYVLILVALIAFIVIATALFRLHAFLVLLAAALIGGIAYGLAPVKVVELIGQGFGNILSGIGLVIVFGTIIGVMLEKSGAALSMAAIVIRLVGRRFPALTMTVIGYIVSIPVFCDSAFVILNGLKNAVAARTGVSITTMSVALATGLFATHTFVPPTPGPIAAAGNVGLGSNLGLLIGLGGVVAAITALAGLVWARLFAGHADESAATLGENAIDPSANDAFEQFEAEYGALPGGVAAFTPILLPIALICIGSIAAFPTAPLGDGVLATAATFIGQPVIALAAGVVAALPLLPTGNRRDALSARVHDGIVAAAPILVITGAGGAFGAVLKATPLADWLGNTLAAQGLGIFMPFVVAAALKTAQGSSTVALVTTSALVAPMLSDLGLGSDLGRTLTVLAIGAGAMTVSHANDSFFWVVSQFSRIPVGLAYRAQTMATLVQGIVGIVTVWILSLLLL
ncbi:GntP family permease [Salinisphaera sp. Q1T1-3]|uniref:GntP family permease n=1 Tax=Salinisphaera sp. Q1T1-3 TaxID=2321229 RepID=UPI000E7616C0|nr:GntP family permease [Salinisphaera sp. Q1T1-3]RJS95231.1 GntP family permease [Salinisphaera sp. Q1T1-3]